MSQVLIGIIGVMLFIGLALAGAMFLGPRFQESTANSKASAALNTATQVAQAANLFVMQEGRAPVATWELVGMNYLKTTPVNPVSNADQIGLQDYDSDGEVEHAAMVIGWTGGAGDPEICETVNKQATGYTGTIPTTAPSGAAGEGVSGCFQNASNQLVVWARI